MPEDLKKEFFNINDMEHVRSSDFRDVYAHHARALPGFYDLRLEFGAILVDRGGNRASSPKPYIEERVAVTITWEHAKLLRGLIDRMLESFEKDHGPVRNKPTDEAAEKKVPSPEAKSV